MNNKEKFLKTKKEIIDWLKQHNIKNYNLIPDKKYGFIIDVNSDVDLFKKDLELIPIKFNMINGDFNCSNNKLISLEECPEDVDGSFNCSNNKLTSLEYCPKIVGGSFDCSYNQLTSLEGCPNNIAGSFYCNNNQLTTLEGCPNNIGGSFLCSYNQLTSLNFCPTIIEDDFFCYNNKIKNYIFFPEKIGGIIILNNRGKYNFEQAYKIHLKDKSEYEKKLLNENMKMPQKVVKNNNNIHKI